jgi:capsular exopolysaccharide synthesis family protein
VPVADLITWLDPRSRVSEAFRGLSFAVGAPGLPGMGETAAVQGVVLVTSAGPGEGKSTAAVNLAVSMARSGARTLLVDANLRSPRVHQTFGMERAPGLAELLAQGGDPDSSVVETSIPGLSVLPSGSVADPGDLLFGRRLPAMLGRLRRRFERIVLDSPSIQAAADAVALGKLADATLLVVGAYQTPRGQAQAAKEYLGALGIPVTGVILNRVHTDEGVAPRLRILAEDLSPGTEGEESVRPEEPAARPSAEAAERR